MEKELVNLLCRLSAQHCLPILAHHRVTTEALRHMNSSDLKKVCLQHPYEHIYLSATALTFHMRYFNIRFLVCQQKVTACQHSSLGLCCCSSIHTESLLAWGLKDCTLSTVKIDAPVLIHSNVSISILPQMCKFA